MKIPNPIQSNPIQSNPIQSNPIQSNPIQSNPIQSNQIKSNQIKSNKIIKLFSASVLIGSAFFAINAHAEGGCPLGMAPMYGNSGSCVPMQQGGFGVEYNYPIIFPVIDRKTDKVYIGHGMKFKKNQAKAQAMQQCQAQGGDCEALTYPTGYCVVVYKRVKPVSFIESRFQGGEKMGSRYSGAFGDNLALAEAKYYTAVNQGKAVKAIYEGCGNQQ